MIQSDNFHGGTFINGRWGLILKGSVCVCVCVGGGGGRGCKGERAIIPWGINRGAGVI